MRKKVKNSCAIDVNGNFDSQVSLFNITGQKKTIDKLMIIREEICHAHMTGKHKYYEPILIIGPTSSTIARAFANSIGSLEYFEMYGSLLYSGGEGLETHLCQGSNLSAYLIKEIDRLSAFCISKIYKLIIDNVIHIAAIPGISEEREIPFNKLLILSAKDESKVSSVLLDQINIVCRLVSYSQKDIYDILNQRITYLGWKIEHDKMLEHIASISQGKVRLAIDILAWIHRCAIAEGREHLTIKDLNRALHLLQ